MQSPIVNRLTLAIAGELAGISRARGFRFDADVECENRTGHRSREGLVILSRDGLHRERPDQFCGKEDNDQDYAVQFEFPIAEDDADLSAEDLLAIGAAEVKRAVMADPKHGGLAIRTFGWTAEAAPPDGSGMNVGTVRFTCWYRTALDDPFNP